MFLLRKGCSRMSRMPILELGSFSMIIFSSCVHSLPRNLGYAMFEFTYVTTDRTISSRFF